MARHRSMLITAGPTHEAIDEVRYLANRSSGQMGVAMAKAARDAGWDVTLLLGPVAASPPDGIRVVRFTSTADLQAQLDKRFPRCNVLIMAAAVADYRPIRMESGKTPRRESKLILEMEPTHDLVARCADSRRPGQRIVGFALEEADRLEERAAEKLRRKRLDALVANPLATMGSPEIRAKLLTADGAVTSPPAPPDGEESLTKPDFARWLIAWIDKHLA